MKIFVVMVLMIFSSATWAHREHGAHVHGSGKLSIAFDQTKGQIEFQTPAMAIVGFEHPAQSKKDKKTVADAISNFEKQITAMIQIDPAVKCSINKEKIEMKADEDGDHSDFVAHFNVACAQSPLGTALTIDFTKYPLLKDLDATVLIGDLQKTAEAKGHPVKIELKP